MANDLKLKCWIVATKTMLVLESTTEAHNHYLQTGSGGFWLYDWTKGALMGSSEAGDILLQAIGLPDKNGKNIYDGDIILWGWDNPSVGHIEWSKGSFSWQIRLVNGNGPDGIRDFWSDRIEVIGNIYENSELLK